MSYKDVFVTQLKSYFSNSVEAAEGINEAWGKIDNYFIDLTEDLEGEINLLGDQLIYYAYQNEITFLIRDQGLIFNKGTFDIFVKVKRLSNVDNYEHLDYDIGNVLDLNRDVFTEESLENWIRDVFGENLDKLR